MKRPSAATLILLISLLIFVFVLLPMLNIQQFLESLRTTDLVLYFFALVALVISNILASYRWSVLLQEINARVSARFHHAVGAFCFGQVAGLIVPSRAGNYTKIPLVKKYDNLSYNAIISAVNAETIMDFAYIGCAGVLSIFILSDIFSQYPWLSAILSSAVLILLVGSLLALYNIHRFEPVYQKMVQSSAKSNTNAWTRIPAKYLAKFFELIHSTKEILSKKTVVGQAGLLTIVTQLFGVLGLFLILQSVHTPLSLTVIFAILTLTYIVGIASLIPGGLGASDLSLIALLGFEGVSLPVATNVMIFWRVAMYLPVIFIVGCYYFSEKFHQRTEHEEIVRRS